MAKNIQRLARLLGAEIGKPVPEVGGGAFGAVRLAQVLQDRLQPSQGKRQGRPCDPEWTLHPKVPMSKSTERRLIALARRINRTGRKVSPMQVAAQLLEDAVRKLA